MPACCSSRPVRRVSSQQTSAACAERLDRAGGRSPRLPIGVLTRTSRAALSTGGHQLGATQRCRSAARGARGPAALGPGWSPTWRTSTTSPTHSPHRSNAPADASIDRARPPHRQADAVAAHRGGADDHAVRVEVGDVDGEAHPDGVHPAAAGAGPTRLRRRPGRGGPCVRSRRDSATSADASTRPLATSHDMALSFARRRGYHHLTWMAAADTDRAARRARHGAHRRRRLASTRTATARWCAAPTGRS